MNVTYSCTSVPNAGRLRWQLKHHVVITAPVSTGITAGVNRQRLTYFFTGPGRISSRYRCAGRRLRGKVRGVKIVVEGRALTVTNQFDQRIESQRPDIRSQPEPNRSEPVRRREIIVVLRIMYS
jgi:hypothetical protein